MGTILFATLTTLGVGAYVGIRLIALFLKGRRNRKESAAERLKLTVNRSAPTFQKPLIGNRNARFVRVVYYAMHKSRFSLLDCASLR